MPQYKKPGTGRDFQPGQSGNPKGRPPIPPEVKAIRNAMQGRYEAIVEKFAGMGKEELTAHLKKPGTPALELWIGQLFIKGINSGDHHRMESVMNRIVGKPKERVELSTPDGPLEYREASDEDLDRQVQELQAELAELKGGAG